MCMIAMVEKFYFALEKVQGSTSFVYEEFLANTCAWEPITVTNQKPKITLYMSKSWIKV
jgi:hypothetical protein